MTLNGGNLTRWLAPLALVLCAVAVLVILNSSGSTGDGGGSEDAVEQQSSSAARQASAAATKKKKAAKRKSRTYTVKRGDTLSGIAQATGVPLSELQERNPDLDSESLQTGQKVKLGP